MVDLYIYCADVAQSASDLDLLSADRRTMTSASWMVKTAS